MKSLTEQIRNETATPDYPDLLARDLVPIVAFEGPEPHEPPTLLLTSPSGTQTRHTYGADTYVCRSHEWAGWAAFVPLHEMGVWTYEWQNTGTEQKQVGSVEVYA